MWRYGIVILRILLVILYCSQFSYSGELPGEALDREVIQVQQEVSQDPTFLPFQGMPVPLWRFLVLEKRHLYMARSARLAVDENGNSVSGVLDQGFPNEELPEHPKHFHPLPVQGYWIPEKEGELFSPSGTEPNFPMRRINPISNEPEILFLVHPKSKNFYSPLTTRYSSNCVQVPALVLSSFRSLLIALTDQNGNYSYWMVKVSLDQEIRGVSRILSRKESVASVVASQVIQSQLHTLSGLSIMEEILSFVPGPQHTRDGKYGGMIVRAIPSVLLDPQTQRLVLPFYALLGEKNLPLFAQMISTSGQSPIQFVSERILKPFARLYTDLVFRLGISTEMHAQNLLLLVDAKTFLPIEGQEFVYRDMGGVSIRYEENRDRGLPSAYQNRDYFYGNHFAKDSGDVLEDHFTGRLLFFLNQQVIHLKSIVEVDSDFRDWEINITQNGQLTNWIHSQPQSKQIQVPLRSFVQYGYFERLFGKILIEEIQNQGILWLIPKSEQFRFQLLKEQFAAQLLDPNPSHAFKDFWEELLNLI